MPFAKFQKLNLGRFFLIKFKQKLEKLHFPDTCTLFSSYNYEND